MAHKMSGSPSTGTVSSTNSPIPSTTNSRTHPHRTHNPIMNEETGQQRIQPQDLIQNFLLIWLDGNLDESKEDFRNSIMQLQQTVDVIEKFRDADECVNYISQFQTEKKAFLIVSGALTENVVPRTHHIAQIYAICIFCGQKSKYEKWATEKWPKVRGVFTKIDSVCASIRQAARECDDDAVVISGELESSFMYTTIFKEIVLEIRFDETKAIPELANYASKQKAYSENRTQLALINKFVRNYHGNIKINEPVRWYTEQCFTYEMLNKALRELDVSTLLKTGFFMRDLHKNIQQLHDEQIKNKETPFPNQVYRGQIMTQKHFLSKIQENKLVSFNNFLSTSEERYVAVRFIPSKLEPNKIGVLFIITLDPSVKSAPYARVAEFSKFPGEK